MQGVLAALIVRVRLDVCGELVHVSSQRDSRSLRRQTWRTKVAICATGSVSAAA